MKEKIWKDIPNYEGLYKISTDGEVVSLKYYQNKTLKTNIHKSGYAHVSLYKNRIKKTFKVHRLVAETFLNNPCNKLQVNHKDGNKKNNNVENLEWCTQEENQIHAFKNGLNHGRRGVENGHHRKVVQYDKEMNKIKTWSYMTEIQECLGINVSNICNCCKGKIKSVGGFIFRYSEVL